MNKLLYRIVFNQARGMLMVVAEIARACSGSSPSAGIGHNHRRLVCRLSAISLSLWLAGGFIQTVQAGIVADKSAPKNQQPTIITSANGTPQVNIQTPSAGGVSRNTFSQFDVDQKGVILNNARKNSATQLGGMVAANPWLAKGEASVILNEVNARDPSRLNGYIEVAGQKAQVVIASPSGITCNGCGFINAGRATLTTGIPLLQNGQISGYQVDRGEIVVEGKGLNTTLQDHTDIIARAVKVNAAIHARDLKVTAGRNRVDAAHEQITPLADNGTARPPLAVDVSQVGGMYAGKIRLRGTEKGVGVRNAGNIGAEAGLVSITADGRIANSGALWSSSDMTVAASGAVDNSGSVAARRHVRVTGAQISSSGTLAAGIQADGAPGDGGDLQLSATGTLTMNGLNTAGGNIHAAGQGLDASASQTQAKNITLDAGQRSLSTAGAKMIAQTSLKAATAATLDNRGGLLAADQLTLNAKRLQNQQGQISQSGARALTLDHQEGIDNRDGAIATNGLLTLNTAGSLVNAGGRIAATQDLSITARGAVNNDRGLLQSAGDMRLTTHGNVLSNRDTAASGGIVSFGKLDIAAGDITNQNGMLAGAQATTLSAANIDNRRGTVSAGDEMTLALAGALDNREGIVSAAGALNTTAERLDNASGAVISGKAARLALARTTNQQGQIAAQGDLSLTGQQLDNSDGGLVQSGGDMMLTVNRISNNRSGERGGITSQGNMQVTAEALQNNAGLLLADKRATLDTASFSNVAGALVAQEAVTLATRSDTANRQGLIQGNGITLDTAGHLLDNQDGTVYSQAAMQLATAGLNNQSGTLGAKGDFTLKGSWLDNRNGGRVVGEQSMQLALSRLDNQNGQIQSVGRMAINALSGAIDNTLGLIRSGAALTLNAASLVNRDTQGEEKGIEGRNVDITSQQLDNRAGQILTGEALAINTAGTLDNRGGELAAGGRLALSGAALNLINTAGRVKAGEEVTIAAERLTGDGQLLSLGDMTVRARQEIVNTGEMIANGNVTLSTAGHLTNSGRLLAGAKLDLTAGSLLNAATGEIAAGSTWLTVTGALSNYGLIDGIQTRIHAGELNNTGTGRIYGDHLAIAATTLNNLAENGTAATLAGRERVDLGVTTLNNRDHALIYSGGDLFLGGQLDGSGAATGQANALNNHSATLESAGDMGLSVRSLSNINDHFATGVARLSTERRHEYQHSGSPNRWDANADGVFVDHNSADSLLNLNTPEDTGSNNDNFYEYDYTRTIDEEVIAESDPGNIIAGGSLSVDADRVLNDKSQIVAGGTLAITARSVDNVEPEGKRWITDEGTVTHFTRKRHKGGDSQGRSTSDYAPPVVIQSITLKPGRMEGNSRADGSGLKLDAAAQQGTTATIQGPGNVAVDLSAVTQPVNVPPGRQVQIPVAGDPDTVVRISGPDTRLPDSSLFTTLPDPSAAYLVETDPRFTSNRQWLGSDYMQNAFATNQDNMHKRLGDGYYEQRLVREQVIALTGQRYLGDHRSDEAQFKALMDAGIAFGKKHNLIPGVALTPAQMSLLTDDMVWLVNADIQLADGSHQTVMVPQVYARLKPGDLDGSGALLSGQSVAMNLSGDLLNRGSIHGRGAVQLSADNITNRAGTVHGADVSLLARSDINNIAGTISASRSVLARAGRDINVTTTTRSAQSRAGGNTFERTTVERVAGIYVQGADGKLALSAGRDVTLTGAQVVNSGKDGQTVVSAGRDVSLKTVATASADNITWDRDNWLKQSATQHAGSAVTGAGSVLLAAGRDLNAQAATVQAGDSLGVVAGRDINLTAATDSSRFESHHKSSGSSGALSKTTVTTHDLVSRETAKGSLFSGDSVTMQAGNNLLLRGSDVVGDSDVRLAAGNNLTITTADTYSQESHQRQEKKSGLSGTGGIGVSYGKQSLKVTDTATGVAQRGSTVGSTGGSVILSAGSDLSVHGSDLIAGQEMTLAGKRVSITAAEEKRTQTRSVEQKSSGLTLALSGAAGSALDGSVRTLQQAKETDNDRLAALTAVKGALSGVQAGQAVALDQAKGDTQGNNNTIGVNLSYGSQSSKSTQVSEQTTAKGSSLTAANNLTVVATDGDVLVQGSGLKAGNDVLLQASRDVNLLSAENRSRLDGKNESKGSSIGAGIGVGSGGAGFSVSANASSSRGREKGNGVWQNETTVDAGKTLSIVSGRDTTLAGAQVSGNRVLADIGRNLTIASLQDSDHYDSKQNSMSGGAGYTFGAGTASAGISASRDKMTSDFTSVQEQSGMFAGQGGFDIRVGEHTQLDGGVIASTATADKNRLDTGTLGWRDIHNQADFKTEHQGAGFSTGGSIAGQFAGNMANSMLAGGGNSGHAEGTTRSAIDNGTLIIRDKENQTQDVAGLSRDTANANGSISPIFDKEKEQRRLQEVQLIGEIGSQAADIARTQGEINALNEARKAHPDMSIRELQDTPEYKREQAKYGTGSDLQRGIQAATAALQGLAGSDLTAALAGAAAPELAYRIGHGMGIDDNTAAKTIAHAILGGAVAALQGNNAAAGAAGAAAGELAAKAIAGMLYPDVKDPSTLSEEQKQTVSALATIAAGMAGGLTGDSTASAMAGAQGGKNSAENNSLAGDQAREAAKQAAESLKTQVREKLGEGTTSAIANAIINGLADAGDAALGSADYVADAAMALASCAAGDSYCNKAMSDLADKNQTVADSVAALMRSETWSAMKHIVVQAYEGNQVALEATGGLLAGIILPGKKVPNIVKAVDPKIKIATGATVGDFEKNLAFLSPRERVAVVKETAPQVAAANGMVKDNKLTKLNNRDVYRGLDGNLYALDTQHGRFEVVTSKGKHLGEVDFSMQKIPNTIDKSGGHNLKVK